MSRFYKDFLEKTTYPNLDDDPADVRKYMCSMLLAIEKDCRILEAESLEKAILQSATVIEEEKMKIKLLEKEWDLKYTAYEKDVEKLNSQFNEAPFNNVFFQLKYHQKRTKLLQQKNILKIMCEWLNMEISSKKL
jgi:hypothetical protein